MKKVLALLLCVVMFVTLLPTFAFADLAAPTLTGATASGNGIKVTWNAVSGAAGYRIYRKTGSASWGKLVDVGAVTSYTDTSAAAGTTYTYTVRCLNSSNTVVSGYDSVGVSGAWTKSTAGYIATPTLVCAAASGSGIKVTWKAVSGAAGYRIYRKTGSGSWSNLADVGAVTSYQDNSAASGTKYTYTVRCLNSSGYVNSDYNTTGVTGSWTASSGLATPKLIGAAAEGSGIRVTWNAVSGAAAYRVYRKTGSNGYSKLVDVSGTSYLDNATTSGTTYTYTVRCLNSSGTVVSSYDSTGVSGSWKSGSTGSLTAPVLKSAAYSGNSVVFSWNAVSGASGYRVYRKTGSGSWVALGNVSGTSYTDTAVSSGTKYTYTVRCLNSSNAVVSGYDATGKSITFYGVPKLVSANSTGSGIQIKWNAVSGASRYLIYRKTTGSFARLATCTTTSYTDTTANANTNYTYTVRVISSDEKTLLSDYDHTGVSASFAGKAQISSLENKNAGVLISWKSVTGVTTFQVQRKSGTGKFLKVANVSGTSYTDTTAVSGTTYTYRIIGIVSASDPTVIGTYDTAGKSITRFATPTLVEAVREGTGIRVTWEAVEGLSTYRVYRKVGSGTYKAQADVSATTYLDTTVASGVEATYTVRGMKDGVVVTSFNSTGVTAKSATFYDQPLLTGCKSDEGGIRISWQKVDGVSKYQIFRHDTSGTSWNKQIITAGGSDADTGEYLDTGVKVGGKYSYTVACVDSANEVASEKNEVGLSATYYVVPSMLKAVNDKTGVKVTWNAADGVGEYNVYRKTGSGGWTRIATAVSGTSYTDTNVKSTAHYSYAVASVVGGTEVSGYAKSAPASTTYYAPPVMNSAVNAATGVKITWATVDGISEYDVWRKVGSGSWTKIATDVGGNTYTDTAATAGQTNTYTVRCKKDGNQVSEYNSTKSVVYMAVPGGLTVTPASKSLKVTWSAVSGAAKYEISYKTSTASSWTTVTGSGTSYTITGLTSGVTYNVRIASVSSEGVKSAVSGTVNGTAK